MVSLMNYVPFGHLLAGFFTGCGLFALACTGAPAAHEVSIQTIATSSQASQVTVTTDINGATSTKTVSAPYGIESSVVVESDGTSTITQATTTPISASQAAQMQQQAEAMQQRMEQMFADQQQMFSGMFGGF